MAPNAQAGRFEDLSAVLAGLEHLPSEQAKRVLVIARRRGGFVKEFPVGRGIRPSGWNYFIPAIGCPADCRYCFLQTYHPSGAPVVFADLEGMLGEIEAKSREVGGGYFYGGELCDNLMLEGVLGMVEPLVELFRSLPAATLELRTKSAHVEGLLAVPAATNVVVAWTFSPEALVREYEPGTSAVRERIEAAARAQAAGFRVGIRFDPIILAAGWRSDYEALVGALAEALDPTLVESVHLGCLRFTPALKAAVAARFGASAPFDGEFAASPDGKLRYPRPLRAGVYAEIARMLAAWRGTVGIRLCMETAAAEADFCRLIPVVK